MSESSPNDIAHADDAASAVDRDAKIEQLLLTGLDHYFAAQYQQAINVWTRALFLDRSHARARAYIERARSAMAERQRETEEQEALAVAVVERASRLDSMQAAASGTRPDRLRQAVDLGTAREGHRSGRTFALAAIAIAVVGVGAYAFLSLRLDWRLLNVFGDLPSPAASAPVARETVLPLPRRGETALARARTLAAAGRLRDALAALDEVRPTDPQKADADRLRADVQHQLLAAIDRP
jgi:hypothetical protein